MRASGFHTFIKLNFFPLMATDAETFEGFPLNLKTSDPLVNDENRIIYPLMAYIIMKKLM